MGKLGPGEMGRASRGGGVLATASGGDVGVDGARVRGGGSERDEDWGMVDKTVGGWGADSNSISEVCRGHG